MAGEVAPARSFDPRVVGRLECQTEQPPSEPLAMRLSDAWVEQGCDEASALLPRERAALVRSYAALLAAVHRPG